MIIYDSHEIKIALHYYHQLTNTVGAVGIAICLTLLQFEAPEIPAWGCSIIFTLWTYDQGSNFRKVLTRTPKGTHSSTFLCIRHGWLAILALTTMIMIANGILTPSTF